MTANAVHDLLVLELLRRKRATPHTPVSVAALVAMKGQRWPLEQLAQTLDVAIEYLNAALGDDAAAFLARMGTDAAFRELVDGLHTPFIKPQNR